MNASLDLQIALKTHLLSSAPVSFALGEGAVFDHVPQDTPFPYLCFGDIETRDWSTQVTRGHEHTIDLHAWSDHKGRREALDIIAAVDEALDQASLILVDHSLISLKTLFSTVLHEVNKSLYHGIIRLRAVTQQNS
jgi:hypothetical protein